MARRDERSILSGLLARAFSHLRVRVVLPISLAGAACNLFFPTDVLTSDKDSGSSGSVDAGGDSGIDAPSSNDAADAVIDASTDGLLQSPTELPWFTDDFKRADSPSLGAQWIEKAQDAFDISGNRALKHAVTGSSYRDVLVHHPTPVIDEQLDVEVSAVFRILALPPGSPQVHARVQSGTVGVADTLESYLVHIQDSDLGLTEARVARQSPTAGEYSVKVGVFTYANTTFVMNERYRLRLRVRGANPVNVAATLEHVKADDTFDLVSSATFTDTDAKQITKPGLVGFGGDGSSDQRFAYEHFEASRLK